ncbi:hypothetical protein vseg_009621 [Gypsophila vaccaria]
MSNSTACHTMCGSIFIVITHWDHFICGFLQTAVISKLLLPSNNIITSAVQIDRYYCFLVPLSLPVIVLAVYFHWLGMKLFKHA